MLLSYIFDGINATLVSIKHFKSLTDPKHLSDSVHVGV